MLFSNLLLIINMKKSYISFVFLVGVLFLPSLMFAQNTISIEISAADLHERSSVDSHKILFEYQRDINSSFAIQAGFSLSQSLKETKSTGFDSEQEAEERIRKGYNYSSFDFFAGLSYNFVQASDFSLPVSVGITPRVRTESYADPDGEIRVNPYTDLDGNRKYRALTPTVYKSPIDLGLFGSLSAGYQLWEDWKISIRSRYQFYTKGFSIFSIGVGGSFEF